MHDTTLFILRLMGPATLAVAVGLFVSHKHYMKMLKNFGKEPVAEFLFAILAMVVGVLMVLHHNMWTTPTEIIVSIMGWGSLIKGVLYMVFPVDMSKMVARMKNSNAVIVPAVIFASVFGLYAVWVGYFMGL